MLSKNLYRGECFQNCFLVVACAIVSLQWHKGQTRVLVDTSPQRGDRFLSFLLRNFKILFSYSLWRTISFTSLIFQQVGRLIHPHVNRLIIRLEDAWRFNKVPITVILVTIYGIMILFVALLSTQTNCFSASMCRTLLTKKHS